MFDIVFSLIVLGLTAPLIILAIMVSTLDTGKFGIFSHIRVGRNGRRFRLFKIRTMTSSAEFDTNVTTASDIRITRIGRIWRKTKIDELPQFFNVFKGDMSIVGPRPDVPGYADRLTGKESIILTVRPGITGPASVYFRDEERLLERQNEPQRFNDEVLWPKKVAINASYLENYSFMEDLRLIADTAFPSLRWSMASRKRFLDEKAKTGIFFSMS